jgi:3'(2'), 5'-bisphosphate nucleotidase
MGSSLKFCLVAEGKADLYLRDLPTMEWDTGAAQCIVQMAGGQVYVWPSLRTSPSHLDASAQPREGATSLSYNKTSLQNPSFLVVGDPTGRWRGPVGVTLDRPNESTTNQ